MDQKLDMEVMAGGHDGLSCISALLSAECDERDHERVVSALIAAFPNGFEETFTIEAITSGFSLSSQLFVLHIDDSHYVLRLIKEVGRADCRAWHVDASQMLADKKLGPDLVYASPDGTILISDLIDEEMPKWNARFDANMAADLAQDLRLLHGVSVAEVRTNRETSPSGLPNDSRERVRAVLDSEPDFVLQAFVLEMLSELETLLSAQSLVHHDLHIGNVLFDGNRFWLIDLESIGIGDPFLDLAVICHMTAGCDGMEEVFLKHYFQRQLTALEQGRLYFAKTVSTLRYAISSFSKCERHADLVGVDVLPVCKYLDYAPDIDGAIDLWSDPGKYWECVALVKLALDYLAAPEFDHAMLSVTGDEAHWGGGLYRPPEQMAATDWSLDITEPMLVALARLLRTLSQASGKLSPTEPLRLTLGTDEDAEIIAAYDRLESVVEQYADPAPRHVALRAVNLIHEAKNGYHRFWLADGTDCGPGCAWFDLATLAIDLDLSERHEQFLLMSHNGSRVLAQEQAYYFLVKQLARLRLAIDDLSAVDGDKWERALGHSRQALKALSSPRYRDALKLLRTNE